MTTASAIAERTPDATAPKAMNVYGCIVAVAAEMASQGIAKTRNNQQQGYKFRGIEDVMNALAPMLAKYRLLILPRVLSREVVERVSKNGAALFYVTVEAEFDFVSAADGSKHTVKTYGEAMDSADKATNKAMSAAYKYAAFQTFCIPTEGDNDADAHTHDVASMTSRGPAHAPAAVVGNPAAATGENRGIVNTTTGEELPPGYHLITDYEFKAPWHEMVVHGLDAQGGAVKLSTKLAAGDTARQACYDQIPVRLDWKPKGPKNPGEGYLNRVYLLPDALPEIQIHGAPLTDEEIPF